MELFLILSAIVIVTAILGLMTTGFGVDSRSFSDDPHRSTYPVGLS